MKHFYHKNYWGKLNQFPIPHSIVSPKETLVLKASALSVLLAIFQIARARRPNPHEPLVSVKVGHKLLRERCGLSKNVVTAAVKELEDKKFLRKITVRKQRGRRGEFSTNEYLVCNPSDHEPLPTTGRNFLYSNHIRYINLPNCVVREQKADWSIARMTSPEIRLYVAFCWRANNSRSSTFTTTALAARKLTGMAKPTFRKALDGLVENRHLISISTKDDDAFEVMLCDPYTGEPLGAQIDNAEDDPANYFVLDQKGRAKRLNLNTSDPAQAEELVLSCLSQDAQVVRQGNSDFKICCPFHHPDDVPSCSVSPAKRCFYCFGCKKRGILTELVEQLKAIGKGPAIQYMAKSLGLAAEYRDPDKDLIIYSYYNEKGNLIKQNLRSRKTLEWKGQRRPGGNGTWIYNLRGVKPLLYNLDRLQNAATVIICEGEKDCDTIMGLNLTDSFGNGVVATTSGGADTWVDGMAEGLRDKRKILMPDADVAGERYASAIKTSLDKRGGEYRIVSFADAGAKDVTDFLELCGGTKDDIVSRIGMDWIRPEIPPQSDSTQDFLSV
jgi:hypothetical protein